MILHMFKLSYISDLQQAKFLFNLCRLGIGVGTLLLILSTFWEYICPHWDTFRIRHFKRDHVVVLGVGDKGYEIAKSLLANKTSVVAVDIDKGTPHFSKLKDKGAFFFCLNMLNPDLFPKLGLLRAKAVYIVSGCDATNIEVVDKLRAFMKENKRCKRMKPLELFVQVHYDIIRNLYWSHENVYSIPNAISFPFSVYDESARYLLNEYSPDRPDRLENWDADKSYHIVVAGFGWLGRKVVQQAIQIGHYARRNDAGTASTEPKKSAPKLKITIIDEEADQHRERFYALFPVLDPNRCHEPQFGGCTPLADIEFIEKDILGLRELPDALKQPISMVFVCLHDEVTALATGRLLHSKLDVKGRTVVALPGESHLISQIEKSLQKEGIDFCEVLKKSCSLEKGEKFLGEKRSELAKQIFKFFKKQFSKEVKAVQNNEEDLNKLINNLWNEAGEWEHRSNHAIIDHLPIKLRMVGIDSSTDKKEAESKIENNIRFLSKTEHERWCAERLLSGWTYGKGRNNNRKIHPSLIPFDDLPENEKIKDEEIIKFHINLWESMNR